MNYRHILIVADIEGSSGCWSYNASQFLTREWASACKELSEDINAVVRALFESGVELITVKDFHRTGFNILPEMIDSRARLVQGYIQGAVPGMGDPEGWDAAMFIGLHAASGTEGFLPHTLTSRIARIDINGRFLTELELFASSLAPYSAVPLFFSGCQAACEQARGVVKNITVYSIDKTGRKECFDTKKWREGLAEKAVSSLKNDAPKFKVPEGPFTVCVTMRDGEKAAEKIAARWRMDRKGKNIVFRAKDIHDLYMQLIRICYLTPFIEKFSGQALKLFNLYGRAGLAFVRWFSSSC